MTKKLKDSKYFEDWLIKAKRDTDTAFLNHRHGGYSDTTCYFCHQTAEKALKAYLLYRGIKFLPRIHSLPKLLLLCSKFDRSFMDLKVTSRDLNLYYIETKYPISPPIDYPKEEADKALEFAEEIVDFVEKKIKSKHS